MIKFRLSLCLVLVSFLRISNCASDSDIEAITSYGIFYGQARTNYIAFEGIPFAQPPVNELRFEPPRPMPKTPNQTFILNGNGPSCLQFNFGNSSLQGEEDCLYLNIYKPRKSSQTLLPVVFHIYGGAFLIGYGWQYGPKYLMEGQDLVYVDFNYRLGVLGYLSSGDEVLPGNQGLKDQAMALSWVKENIASFGGDPDNIMITGFSSGAGSSHLFYFSPLTKDNFASGISHSGTALSAWTLYKNVTERYNKVLDLFGCNSTDKYQNVQCLKSLAADRLVNKTFHQKDFYLFPVITFSLSIEPESDHAFLTDTPFNLLKQGKVARKPWLTTVVKDEGIPVAVLFVNDSKTMNDINANWTDHAPFMFVYDWITSDADKLAISTKIRERYFGSAPVDFGHFMNFTNVFSDRYFLQLVGPVLAYMSQLMPTYFYTFDFKGIYGFGQYASQRSYFPGVAHGDHVQLIYDADYRTGIPFTDAEQRLSKKLLGLYRSMAYTGVPTIDGLEFPPLAYDSNENIHGIYVHSPDDIERISIPQSTLGDYAFWKDAFGNYSLL